MFKLLICKGKKLVFPCIKKKLSHQIHQKFTLIFSFRKSSEITPFYLYIALCSALLMRPRIRDFESAEDVWLDEYLGLGLALRKARFSLHAREVACFRQIPNASDKHFIISWLLILSMLPLRWYHHHVKKVHWKASLPTKWAVRDVHCSKINARCLKDAS